MRDLIVWLMVTGALVFAAWVGTRQVDDPEPPIHVQCGVSDVTTLEQRIDRLMMERSLRDEQLDERLQTLQREIERNGCAARQLGNTQPGRARLSMGLDAKLPLLSQCGEYL